MVKCKTCGGIYEPTLPDGTQYFHACPPLAPREIVAGLRDGTVTLLRADQQRLRQARLDDAASPVAADEPTREQLVLRSLVVERPNRRDENIRPGVDQREKGSRIKAEGAGVDPVVDA